MSGMWSRPLVVVLILGCCCSAELRGQESPTPRKVALLAGVNEYGRRGFDTLQYAERDVQTLADLLQKQGFRVVLLKGSGRGTASATKANIEAALDRLLRGVGKRDIVLVGLAGHGQQMPLRDDQGRLVQDRFGRPVEDAFFCPQDAVKGDPATLLSLTELMETLDRKGGVNLVLVDACRDNPNPGRGARSLAGNEFKGHLPANTAILFSCAAGQQALETADAGGGHGVFFYHVLEGLRGAAANRRGEVTWNTLVSYVQETVNGQAAEWFPDRAREATAGLVQTPHELRNLRQVPVLVRAEAADRPSEETVQRPQSTEAGETEDEESRERGVIYEEIEELVSKELISRSQGARVRAHYLVYLKSRRQGEAGKRPFRVVVPISNGAEVKVRSNVIATVRRGDTYFFEEASGEWFLISVDGGRGWIHRSDVAVIPSHNPLTPDFAGFPTPPGTGSSDFAAGGGFAPAMLGD